MVVWTLLPEVVAGSDTFGSNGLDVLAPLIPKTVIQFSAVLAEDSVAVMVTELRVEDATAYHSSRSVMYAGGPAKEYVGVVTLRCQVRPPPEIPETDGGVAVPSLAGL